MNDESTMNKSEPVMSDVEKELDELIQLAEQSAKKLDELNDLIAKYQNRWLYQAIAVYLTICGSVGGLLALWRQSNSANTPFVLGLLVVFTVFVGLLWILTFSRKTVVSKARREIRVEWDVLDSIISLIDQQQKRMVIYKNISPVTRAIFDIRIRRLFRSRAE